MGSRTHYAVKDNKKQIRSTEEKSRKTVRPSIHEEKKLNKKQRKQQAKDEAEEFFTAEKTQYLNTQIETRQKRLARKDKEHDALIKNAKKKKDAKKAEESARLYSRAATTADEMRTIELELSIHKQYLSAVNTTSVQNMDLSTLRSTIEITVAKREARKKGPQAHVGPIQPLVLPKA